MKKLETIKRSSRNWEKKKEEASVVFLFCCCSSRSESAVLLRFPIIAIASSSSSSPVGGFAPLDSVIVGSGVRFARMDGTSVRLDGWRFGRAESGVASFTSPKIHWGGVRGCFTKSLHILIHQLVTHSLFQKLFVSYDLVSFQFLKHDRHAQKFCISKFTTLIA